MDKEGQVLITGKRNYKDGKVEVQNEPMWYWIGLEVTV